MVVTVYNAACREDRSIFQLHPSIMFVWKTNSQRFSTATTCVDTTPERSEIIIMVFGFFVSYRRHHVP